MFPTIFLSNAATICQYVQWQGFLLASSDQSNSGNDKVPHWCEGFIHPSSFAQELPVSFASTERLKNIPKWMFITFIQLARHLTEYRVPMQVSTSDHCETVRQPKVRTIKSVSSQCWWLRKLEFCRHLRPCVRKILGCWCCRVMIHFGWGSGLRQEWAQHAAVPGFHNRSMTLSRVSDRC